MKFFKLVCVISTVLVASCAHTQFENDYSENIDQNDQMLPAEKINNSIIDLFLNGSTNKTFVSCMNNESLNNLEAGLEAHEYTTPF